MMEQFLKLFFNEGETFCVSPNKYAYHSVGFDSFLNNKVELISPNPEMLPVTVPFSSMSMMGLNPTKGVRNDENCTAFRSFLVEMDNGTIEEQIRYIKSIRLPYSCCVFSGNKSLHFGIVLAEDLGSLEVYKHVAEWILAICSKADPQTGPPSRCIRMPGVKRGKNMQTLLEIKNRVPLADMMAFLSKHKKLRPVYKEKTEYVKIEGDGKIPYWVFLAFNDVSAYAAKNGDGRNQTWFKLFVALAEVGKSLEEILAFGAPHFEPEPDFKRSEWEGIAESAFKRINKGIV